MGSSGRMGPRKQMGPRGWMSPRGQMGHSGQISCPTVCLWDCQTVESKFLRLRCLTFSEVSSVRLHRRRRSRRFSEDHLLLRLRIGGPSDLKLDLDQDYLGQNITFMNQKWLFLHIMWCYNLNRICLFVLYQPLATAFRVKANECLKCVWLFKLDSKINQPFRNLQIYWVDYGTLPDPHFPKNLFFLLNNPHQKTLNWTENQIFFIIRREISEEMQQPVLCSAADEWKTFVSYLCN